MISSRSVNLSRADEEQAGEILQRIHDHVMRFKDGEAPVFEINAIEFYALKRYLLATRPEVQADWMPFGVLPPLFGIRCKVIDNKENDNANTR